jgi:hypothetical protein
MNHPHVGWQCPCCRKVYAPSVTQCAPCSGTSPPLFPIVHPHPAAQPVVPTMWEPQPTTCKSITVLADPAGGWLINGEPAQITPTYGAN